MRRGFGYGVAALGVAALLMCMGLAAPLQFLLLLPFGWIFYVRRVAPQVTIDGYGVATAAASLVLFTVGLHAFFRWLARALRPEGAAWPFRWTASVVGTLTLMFAAGIATVGVAHQVGWLVRAKEPFFFNGSREFRRIFSQQNLKGIGLGFHNYSSAYDDRLPPGATFDAAGRPLHGWWLLLDTYVESRKGFHPVDLERPWDDPRNAPRFREDRPGYRNLAIRETRDRAGFALAHYASNGRVVGGDRARSFDSIRDGTSTTLLAGEVAANFQPWGHPIQWRDPAKGINRSPDGFGSPFTGGATMLMVDGSARFVRETIDPRVLAALATPDGGESIAPDAW